MTKRIIALLSAILMLLSFASCGENGGETTTDAPSTTNYIRENKTVVAAVKDVSGFGVSKLAKDRDYAYDVTYYDDVQQVVDMIKSGKADIASMSLSNATELCTTDASVKIIASNNLATMYVLTKGVEISGFSDLKKNKIYTLKNDCETQLFTETLLKENSVDYESLDIQEMSSIDELANEIAGKDKYVLMLAGVDAAKLSADEGRKTAIDFTGKWIEQKKSLPIHSVVVARNEYIESNPDIIDEFIMFNEVSVNFIINNAESGSIHLNESGFFADVEASLTYLSNYSSLNYAEKERMKKIVNESLGFVGAELLPDEAFYIAK